MVEAQAGFIRATTRWRSTRWTPAARPGERQRIGAMLRTLSGSGFQSGRRAGDRSCGECRCPRRPGHAERSAARLRAGLGRAGLREMGDRRRAPPGCTITFNAARQPGRCWGPPSCRHQHERGARRSRAFAGGGPYQPGDQAHVARRAGFVIFIDEAASHVNAGFRALARGREYRKPGGAGGAVGMAFQDLAALLKTGALGPLSRTRRVFCFPQFQGVGGSLNSG